MRILTRVLALASLIFSVLGVTFFHALAATSHGCAPSTPPPVSGQPITPNPVAGIVLINEVLLVPASPWNCSDTGSSSIDQDAWVELYNPQSQPYDLYAANANLDSGPGTDPFFFLAGSAIAPQGFLTIFPDASPSFTGAQTLEIRLKFANTVIDDIHISSLGQDQSLARMPDGGTDWKITDTPTIDATNNPAQPTPTSTLINSTLRADATATARIDHANATATVRADRVDATATARVDHADATTTAQADRIDATATARLDHADATATARADRILLTPGASSTSSSANAPLSPGTANTTGNISGSNAGTDGAITDQPTPIAGVQPTWSAFQFPSEAAATPVETDQSVVDTPQTPVSNATDTPRKALFTMAAITVFALVLFGCWRLVKKRLSQNQ